MFNTQHHITNNELSRISINHDERHTNLQSLHPTSNNYWPHELPSNSYMSHSGQHSLLPITCDQNQEQQRQHFHELLDPAEMAPAQEALDGAGERQSIEKSFPVSGSDESDANECGCGADYAVCGDSVGITKVYHRKLANLRERRRMQSINRGFEVSRERERERESAITFIFIIDQLID